MIRTTLIAMCLVTTASAAHAEDIEWKDEWREVGWPEAITAGVLTLGNLSVGLIWDPPEGRGMGGILFDDAAVELFSGRTPEVRAFAQEASNYLWYGLEFYPLVIDAGLVTLAIHQKPHVALQLAVIDFNALALTGLMSQIAHHTIPRDRPIRKDCIEGEDGPAECGAYNRYRSFWSGHTAFAFTGAGLICAHHANLNLYGSETAGTVACVTGLTLATATGVFRMVNDKHYATDILVAAGVGILNGYVLPQLIYYHDDPKKPQSTMRITPLASDDMLGLTLGGSW